MARMASVAAWGLSQWDSMEEYLCFIPRTSYDGAFMRAVFALHSEHFQLAQQVGIMRAVFALHSEHFQLAQQVGIMGVVVALLFQLAQQVGIHLTPVMSDRFASLTLPTSTDIFAIL
jgi:hypothetical protein